jgi:hypothetical protein
VTLTRSKMGTALGGKNASQLARDPRDGARRAARGGQRLSDNAPEVRRSRSRRAARRLRSVPLAALAPRRGAVAPPARSGPRGPSRERCVSAEPTQTARCAAAERTPFLGTTATVAATAMLSTAQFRRTSYTVRAVASQAALQTGVAPLREPRSPEAADRARHAGRCAHHSPATPYAPSRRRYCRAHRQGRPGTLDMPTAWMAGTDLRRRETAFL